MLKLAGVVILYHPDLSKTIENIATYASQLNKLYLFDNSVQPSMDVSKDLAHLKIPIEYITTGTNEGIAKRLNEASHKARQESYDFLLTMDQDSSFKPGDFEKYKSLIQSSNNSNVAQYGVNHQPDFTPAKDLPEEALALITSGSILNLSLTDKVGVFNEYFFIDFVDTEFSYRVIQNGYINLMFSNIVLNHSLGTLIEGRSLVSLKKSKRIIHSPIRVFYVIRNGLYLLFKVKGLSASMKQEVIRSIKIIKNDLIYNPQLLAVYKNLFLGVYCFVFNKMGKK
jgi:rhamnosyltransferase